MKKGKKFFFTHFFFSGAMMATLSAIIPSLWSCLVNFTSLSLSVDSPAFRKYTFSGVGLHSFDSTTIVMSCISFNVWRSTTPFSIWSVLEPSSSTITTANHRDDTKNPSPNRWRFVLEKLLFYITRENFFHIFSLSLFFVCFINQNYIMCSSIRHTVTVLWLRRGTSGESPVKTTKKRGNEKKEEKWISEYWKTRLSLFFSFSFVVVQRIVGSFEKWGWWVVEIKQHLSLPRKAIWNFMSEKMRFYRIFKPVSNSIPDFLQN